LMLVLGVGGQFDGSSLALSRLPGPVGRPPPAGLDDQSR
jgi:hypothetical protein